MSIKVFRKLLIAGLVLAYPFLTHWVLPLWPALPNLVLTMPPALLNGALAWLFGRTLRAGREPLIATFARLERAQLLHMPNVDLPPEMLGYTRTLTQIWSILLCGMAIAAALLSWSGMLGWWAWFTGAISYALLGVLFAGEYVYRRLRFSQYSHANPFQFAWFLIKSGPIWLRRIP